MVGFREFHGRESAGEVDFCKRHSLVLVLTPDGITATVLEPMKPSDTPAGKQRFSTTSIVAASFTVACPLSPFIIWGGHSVGILGNNFLYAIYVAPVACSMAGVIVGISGLQEKLGRRLCIISIVVSAIFLMTLLGLMVAFW